MPYYITSKAIPVPESYADIKGLQSYETRELAFNDIPNKRDYIITFVASSNERYTWEGREQGRFNNGEYSVTPWHSHSYARYGKPQRHYAHLSLTEPGKIAFTPDDEHGITDRHVRMRPGRYLSQYYTGELSKLEIDEYAAECSATNLELKIARSTEDIVRIYSSTDTGFSSCMQSRRYNDGSSCDCDPDDECDCPSDDERYVWQTRMDEDDYLHPVSVYGESDLGVAYRGDIDCVKQRAVVWPDKRQYVRIYGSGALETLLKRAGYSKTIEFVGARVRRIKYPDSDYSRRYYMPYIDSSSFNCKASECGEWFVLGKGSTPTGDTSGYTDEVITRSCVECGDEFNPGSGDHTMCGSCRNNFYTCDQCHTRRDRREHVCLHYTRVGNICQTCYDSIATTCATEGCGSRWVETLDFRQNAQNQRTRHHSTHLCFSCYEYHMWCDTCETLTDRRREGVSSWDDDYLDPQCPNCSRYPRCNRTRDLLTQAATTITWESTF